MTHLYKLQTEICEIGKLLYDRGYVVSNDGNISVRVREDEIWITPSGVSKGRMSPEMLVKVDLTGNILEGEFHPSSELKMHLTLYQERSDIQAVVHAHPPVSTAFAVCRRPLVAPYLPEMLVQLGEVPVAAFALPSTEEVSESIKPYIHTHQAVLLANHGALTWASSLWKAFDLMEVTEHMAKIYAQIAQIGEGKQLTEEEVARILSLRETYLAFSGKNSDQKEHTK